MNVEELEQSRQNPPREWVKLRANENESFSEGDYAKAFCKFVLKFYWRPVEDGSGELHMIFRNDNNDRYKYPDVDKSTYDEMWERAYFPQDYDRPIGSWITKNITQTLSCEKYYSD